MTPFPLSALCVRMPQLVMGASTCALLLRLSLVSMQGASGLATDTYKFVAVSLTLASVCTGLAQIMQVCIYLFAAAVLLFSFVNAVVQRHHAWIMCRVSGS